MSDDKGPRLQQMSQKICSRESKSVKDKMLISQTVQIVERDAPEEESLSTKAISRKQQAA